MNKTKIKFDGSWEILDSGTLIHYDINYAVTLSVIESDNTPINSRIVFKKDDDINDASISLSHFNKDTIQILVSHKGSLFDFGFKKPIKFGSYDGRELFFNYRVSLTENAVSALIHFTWYLGEEGEA